MRSPDHRRGGTRARLGAGLRTARQVIDALPPSVVLTGVLATAVAVVVLGGVAVAEVLDEVMGGEGGGRVDGRIAEWVRQHRTATLTTSFTIATRLADGWFVAAVVAITATVLLLRRRPALAVAVVVSSAGAAAITWAVKELVGRNRPDALARLVEASGDAFPSGHSSQVVACYGAVALVVAVSGVRTAWRITAVAVALGLTAVVGASRIYLGVHWPSDVISGWIVGLAWLTAVAAVTWALYRVDRPRGWWHAVRRRPAAAAPAGGRTSTGASGRSRGGLRFRRRHFRR